MYGITKWRIKLQNSENQIGNENGIIDKNNEKSGLIPSPEEAAVNAEMLKLLHEIEDDIKENCKVDLINSITEQHKKHFQIKDGIVENLSSTPIIIKRK